MSEPLNTSKLISVTDEIYNYRFFNTDVYELKTPVPYFNITSVENIKYCASDEQMDKKCGGFFKNKPILNEFLKENYFLQVNEYIRDRRTDNSITNKFILDFNEFVSNSPILDHKMILYRGIPHEIKTTINDTLFNLGFIFCSLDKETAKYYLNDTSDCYTNLGQSIALFKKTEKGTLFKIIVPEYSHFIDLSYYRYDSSKDVYSQIILPNNISFLVTKVKNVNNTTYITMTIK